MLGQLPPSDPKNINECSFKSIAKDFCSCSGLASCQSHPRKQAQLIIACITESNAILPPSALVEMYSPCVLQGQSDLLRGAKMDSLDALRQLALACEACGLTSSSSSSNSSSSTFSTAELHYSSHPLSGRRSSTHGNGRI